MGQARHRQFGQDVTEYIIIVALLTIAAIAVYGLFGDTLRGQSEAGDEALGSARNTALTAPPLRLASPLTAHLRQP